MKFRFLKHTADIKFRAYGKSPREIFINSALALKKIISEDKIKGKKKKKIKVGGNDFEGLMYGFLEEFLVLFDSDNFILSKIVSLKFDKKNFKIDAEVLGDNSSDYENSHVKAITYNEMFVKKIKDKWVSQVVVDV